MIHHRFVPDPRVGGFSVYAGRGGAGHVTSVDIAAPASAAAERNWGLNGLQVVHCPYYGGHCPYYGGHWLFVFKS